MTQLPASVPGTLPLPALPGSAVPGTVPTPSAPAGAAKPFLALLSLLLGGPPAPEAAPEQAPTDAPPDPADATHEPEDGDEADDRAVSALPLVPQLAAVVLPPATATGPSPKARQGAQAPAVEAFPTTAPTTAPSTGPVAAERPRVAAPAGTDEPTTAVVPAPVAGAPQLSAHQAPKPAVAAPSITHQVFPEVVRVAAAGDTPRIVVRLQPEHLGEVRVVLRSGRGGLEVSLAADTEARAVLREGAPELRRMLEATGSPGARIMVRHLVDVAAPPTSVTAAAQTAVTSPVRTDTPSPVPGTSVDVGAGTTGGTSHGDRRGQPRQDARPVATEGRPHRSPELVARRTGGLDLMM